MFEGRLNEIAMAFHFEKFGKIGFIDETMSVYRQHSQGLWSGSDDIRRLKSGLKVRQMVKDIARPKYRGFIEKIIEEKYMVPLRRNGHS